MDQRRNKSLLCIVMAAALAFSSCGRRPLYSHFESTGPDGWDITDTLRFAVPISESGTYTMRLDLRANSHYPYTQILLTASQQAQRSKADRTDSLCFNITDDEGNFLGRGTTVFQYAATLTPATLQKGDTLRLALAHSMRRRTLEGIIDLGITVSLYSKH